MKFKHNSRLCLIATRAHSKIYFFFQKKNLTYMWHLSHSLPGPICSQKKEWGKKLHPCFINWFPQPVNWLTIYWFSQLWLLASLFPVARNLTSLNPALYHFQMTYKITITGNQPHTPPTCENNVVLLQCMHLSPLCESVCVSSFCVSLFQSADNSLCVFSHPAFCKLCWGTVLPPILMNVVKLVRRRDPGCFLSGSPPPESNV